MTQINYKALIQHAMLNMVKDILKKISQSGLPKNHHFLITFFSNSNGVIIPDWMKEKYPEKMTIIIRSWFENLSVTEKKFEISLNFNNTVEHLTIPFSSLELFADPSVDFAISFNQSDNISSSETKIKEEKGDQNTDDKKEKPSTKIKNVIDLKKFKK
tara:strand:- start:12 stop:485 length:474 start_codon:yes stop_codon:yes gene_type:complete